MTNGSGESRRGNVVQEKSYAFALKIIKFYKYLTFERKEYILGKQILRSGTSIGANIEEAIGGHSKKDFLAKFVIAYKEARETHYWLRLLKDSQIATGPTLQKLTLDCEELLKIMTTIQRTTKENLKQG